MPNLIRDNMPLVHSAIEEFLSDEVVLLRVGHAPLQTSASPLPPVEEEAVQQGNNLRLFMSLTQCGGIAPTTLDQVTKGLVTYRITDVVADDYDGFSLSLRAIS
jgi:hypothetical protein